MQRDLAGNRIADVGALRTYTYNNANRLSAVLDSGLTTASYVHNALGQRTKKTVGSSDVIYLYDLAGQLIAEHDGSGALVRDYLWLDGLPVAQIDAGEAFLYLHVDHLATPRLATDDSGTVVWRWDSDAFGSTLANEDPDGNSSATTVNLRFPGQYFDQETGFHYNYFRTYDPTIGRYVESDPIGLRGGSNTYGYAAASPMSHSDPLGLFISSLDAACAIDPFFCGEVLGDVSHAPANLAGKHDVCIDEYGLAALNLDSMPLLAETVAVTAAAIQMKRGTISRNSVVVAVNAADNVATPVSTGPVSAYEVGQANNLRARSVVGDGLDVHHAGQAHPMEQLVSGYDRASGPAIAAPRAEHVQIPTVRGPVTGNARDQLAKDIRDLRNFTNAPNSSLQELIELNRRLYPEAFQK